MPLNNKICEAAKPSEKPRKLADGGGLYLEVMPNGARYWRLKYRFMGKEKRLALGVYPETTLAEAREKREQARKLLANGADPAFVKKEQKLQARLSAGNTFEDVAREWHEHQSSKWTPSYADNVLHRLTTDIFPLISHLPIAQITPPHLLDAMRQIEKRGAHEIAHRLLQSCSQIFRYAIVTGRADRNPALDLRGALKTVPHGHYAAMDAKELPDFLGALERNDARLYAHTRLALRLMLLTFVRTAELIAATWDEIDFGDRRWIIPAERMKMRRPHIVPLSTQAISTLQELKVLAGHREQIFPSQIRAHKHMSNNTILKALERMGYKGKATGHGFRALAMSTIKEQLGYRHEVIDRQLAHAPRNKVDAAYDRAQFLEERTRMMQDWADHIDKLSGFGTVVKRNFGNVA